MPHDIPALWYSSRQLTLCAGNPSLWYSPVNDVDNSPYLVQHSVRLHKARTGWCHFLSWLILQLLLLCMIHIHHRPLLYLTSDIGVLVLKQRRLMLSPTVYFRPVILFRRLTLTVSVATNKSAHPIAPKIDTQAACYFSLIGNTMYNSTKALQSKLE